MSKTPYGIAFPSASLGKSCTRTAGGVAFGCHSRPAFAKFPTSSFFLVSTEITGCPVFRNRSAVALMCSNCSLRSGWTVPSCRLRTDCNRYPRRWSRRPTVVELTRHPCSLNAAASFARLLHVHRSGDVGSPRVNGSTSASRAARTPGWSCSIPGRPAPGARMRLVGGSPRAISRRPLRIVSRAKPVADDTSASPP